MSPSWYFKDRGGVRPRQMTAVTARAAPSLARPWSGLLCWLLSSGSGLHLCTKGFSCNTHTQAEERPFDSVKGRFRMCPFHTLQLRTPSSGGLGSRCWQVKIRVGTWQRSR